jgi:hypothetical protein
MTDDVVTGSDAMSDNTFWLLFGIAVIVYCAVVSIRKKLDEIGKRIVWLYRRRKSAKKRFKRPSGNLIGKDKGDAPCLYC